MIPTRWPRAFAESVAVLMLATLAMQGGLYAAAPAWWTARGVLTSGAQADDYAVINQGQLKNLAYAACQELNANLPGGAEDEINNLVNSWLVTTPATENYAAVTQGQLKALAALFYDRLIAAGLAVEYPWAQSATPPDDYAVANIGQAKQLFSFDLAMPAHGSGASAVPLTLTALSGNHQTVIEGATTDGPLVVRATRAGVPWAGVAVTFQTASGSLSTTQSTTDTSGNAYVTYTAAGPGTVSIGAAAESATVSMIVNVVAAGGAPTNPNDPEPPEPGTTIDWAAVNAAYEIGLQERSRSADTDVWESGSGWPDPDDPETWDNSLTYDYWTYLDDDLFSEIWSGSCTINTSGIADELAEGAAAAHAAVDGAALADDWEPVEPAGENDVAMLSQSGGVEAYATIERGVGTAKAEYRLVRRLKSGATQPKDANGHPIKPEVKRTFLKVHARTPATDAAPPPPEVVEFTIPADAEVSTTSTGPLFPPLTEAGTYRIDLLPVEFKMGFKDDEPITRLSTGEEVDPDQKTYILGSAVPEAERFGMVAYRGGLDMNIFFIAKFSLAASNGTATMDVKVKRMGEVIASRPNIATLQQGENLVKVDTVSIPCASVIGTGPTSNDEALEIIATVHQGSQSYDLPLGKVECELFVTKEKPTASVIFDKALELFDDAYDLLQNGASSSIPEALASVIDDRFTYFAGKPDSLDAEARFEAKSLMCLDHVKVMQDIFGSMGMDEGKRIAMWGGRLDPSERNMVYDDWLVLKDNKCSIKHASGGDEVTPTDAEYTVHALLLIDGHYCDPAYGATYPDAAAAKAKGTALWNFYKPKDPGVVVRVEEEIKYNTSTWVQRERDGP